MKKEPNWFLFLFVETEDLKKSKKSRQLIR